MPVGQRILVEVQPVHTGGIEEGLQLHHDDVGLDLHVGGAVIDLVHQFLHRFLGIAVGLADARIQHRHGKAVRESVFPVAVGQVVKVIGEDIGSKQQDRQSVKRGKGHQYQRHVQCILDLLSVFRGVPEGPYQTDNDEDQDDAEQRHLQVGAVLRQDGESFLNGPHVLSGEGRDAACQHQSVHRTHQKPNETDEDPCKAPAPGEKHQRQRQIDHEGVVQIDLLMGHHEHRGFRQGMPGHGLDEKIQDEGQNEMVDQGILVEKCRQLFQLFRPLLLLLRLRLIDLFFLLKHDIGPRSQKTTFFKKKQNDQINWKYLSKSDPFLP